MYEYAHIENPLKTTVHRDLPKIAEPLKNNPNRIVLGSTKKRLGKIYLAVV